MNGRGLRRDALYRREKCRPPPPAASPARDSRKRRPPTLGPSGPNSRQTRTVARHGHRLLPTQTTDLVI
ncbi:Hypothetical protein NTJ_06412 [Nesidiocoris tenuis]|uniref:Uncharacterized protein n=1 Tax=Nesidiocoris tenuis TaxID=355587 RepID=A0ABN7ANF9_9HEMI|nr:Hypothetical protein NTJ_06412 [Nesidiocoris tenuis]